MKAIVTVEMDDMERDVFNALVYLSRVTNPEDLEGLQFTKDLKVFHPDIWKLFTIDRMCGECTGLGGNFGVPCKVCMGTGVIEVKER